MKLLIIGDIHSKRSSLEVVDQVLTKCAKLAIKAQCDLTVCLGDINDTKSTLASKTVDQLIKHFSNWPTPVIAMVGNHDLNNALDPSLGHSLEFLKLLPNVTVIDKPTTIGDLFFIPYLPEQQFLQVELAPTPYCFIHQDVKTAVYSNNREVESTIDPSYLSKYKRVISGHIHKAQQIANIHYIGTPYTESFKESDENKQVAILDTNKDHLLLVPTLVRQHKTYEYSINELKDVKDIISDLHSKQNPNHLIRVIINVPDEIESKIKRSLFKGLSIESLKTNPIRNPNKKLNVTDSMSNLETMELYLSQLSLPDKIKALVETLNRDILNNLT
jgi:DNA repair exonuclease SbcCD nuclease subunit